MLSRATRASSLGLLFSRANRRCRRPLKTSSPGGEPQQVLHRLAAASAQPRVVRRVVRPVLALVPVALLVRVVLVRQRVVQDRKGKGKVVDTVVEREEVVAGLEAEPRISQVPANR
jgi:hypothetical protein